MLDTVHTVETPEGVRLDLRAAGPVPRALAFFVDAFLRGVFYFTTLVAVAMLLPDLVGSVLVLLVFLGEWFYPVFFEVWNHGQTPGKRVVGLRVVREDGTRVGWSASLLRNLLLAADWLPAAYAGGFAAMLASRSFQRLGDRAAGTLVVHAERVPAGRSEAALGTLDGVAPLASPIPLTVAEQRAVIAFAERAPHFSDARRDELAALATPLHRAPQAPRERLLAMAAWLLGRTRAEGA